MDWRARGSQEERCDQEEKRALSAMDYAKGKQILKSELWICMD